MKLLSAAQIKELDNLTIKNEPVSSFLLMERAATACVNYLKATFDASFSFLIFCGKGNNGGDGLAIARLLAKNGYHAQVILLNQKQKGSGDYEKNLSLVKKNKKIKIHHFSPTLQIEKDKKFIVVDALLGTGFTGEIREELVPVIQTINNTMLPVISIDVPSGLPADFTTGIKTEHIVKANGTLSFHVPKKTMLYQPGSLLSGEIIVLDIGLSPEAYAAFDSNEFLLHPAEISNLIRVREKESAKWQYGHALIIAGSNEKPGAAILASKACLRSGTGLCTLLSAENVVSKSIEHTPELIGTVWHDEMDFPKPEFLSKFTAVGIGPGCGTNEDFKKILKWILQLNVQPMVLDADAVNVLAENKTWLAFSGAPKILTPHFREFCRLTNCPVNANQQEIDEHLTSFSRKFNCIVVLKSAYTRVATPSGNIYVNFTGNAGLAKAGSGDILTGIITALLAQGYDTYEAAVIGVCLHGRAADITLENQSYESMLASDVTKNLGTAFKSLLQRETSS